MSAPHSIRPYTPADAAAVAALIAAEPESGRCDFEHASPDDLLAFDAGFAALGCAPARVVSALPDGQIAGFAHTFRIPWSARDAHYWVAVRVAPAHRRRGVGRALYERACAALPSPALLAAQVREDQPEGLAAAERAGFREVFRSLEYQLVLADVAPVAPGPWLERAAASGITFATLAEVIARDPAWLPKVYSLHRELSREVPIPDRFALTEGQLGDYLTRSPGALPEAFFLALDGEQPVGQSFMQPAQGYPTWLSQKLTGVLPAYRGRGIAQALKLLTIAYARQHGYEGISTWIETNNPAMLAISDRLGFVRQPGGLVVLEKPAPPLGDQTILR